MRISSVILTVFLSIVFVLPACAQNKSEELLIFGFEKDLQDWNIPEWEVKDTTYYSAEDIAVSGYYASEGDYSLEMLVNFPGGSWKGAYVERNMHVIDWTEFSAARVDIYVPQSAPTGLKGRIILSVGDKLVSKEEDRWKWTEMNKGIPLIPGQWTTIEANVKEGSTDWKFFPDANFRKEIMKIGVRVESDNKPAYQGPVYIDNVRLVK